MSWSTTAAGESPSKLASPRLWLNEGAVPLVQINPDDVQHRRYCFGTLRRLSERLR